MNLYAQLYGRKLAWTTGVMIVQPGHGMGLQRGYVTTLGCAPTVVDPFK